MSMTRYEDDNKRRQPSKAARRRAKMAFDAETLIRICEMEPQEFGQYADRVDLESTRWSRDRFYYHRDNGSNILAVAHLDHVQDNRKTNVMDTGAGLLVASGVLDDRLGAYVILELLPKLGMTFDILLTTDEEQGASTADEFKPEKQYDWMIEFDRGGTDVVMYEYETQEYADLVEASGARMGQGSFSDIAVLEHLGCAGFNWGVGYRDYHSARGHAWLEDTFRMVARFEKFWKANGSTHLPHVPWVPRKRGFSLVVADCAHLVDLEDENEWMELDNVLVCTKCATMPEVV